MNNSKENKIKIDFIRPNNFTYNSINSDGICKYGLENIGLNSPNGIKLLDETNGGENITVAIMDTGVDYNHEYLSGFVSERLDFLDKYEYDPKADTRLTLHTHGTHVAGIVHATAPKAKLIDLRIFDSTGSNDWGNIISSLNWCLLNHNKLDVINMSFGINVLSNLLVNDFNNLNIMINKISQLRLEYGVIICVAAGNDGTKYIEDLNISYPGYMNEVICVGAIDPNPAVNDSFRNYDKQNFLASFSNANSQVDIVAPGVKILSSSTHATVKYDDKNKSEYISLMNDEYIELGGTSMATPFVSGFCALLLKKYNRMNNIDNITLSDKLKRANWLQGLPIKSQLFDANDVIQTPKNNPVGELINNYCDKKNPYNNEYGFGKLNIKN